MLVKSFAALPRSVLPSARQEAKKSLDPLHSINHEKVIPRGREIRQFSSQVNDLNNTIFYSENSKRENIHTALGIESVGFSCTTCT